VVHHAPVVPLRRILRLLPVLLDPLHEVARLMGLPHRIIDHGPASLKVLLCIECADKAGYLPGKRLYCVRVALRLAAIIDVEGVSIAAL